MNFYVAVAKKIHHISYKYQSFDALWANNRLLGFKRAGLLRCVDYYIFNPRAEELRGQTVQVLISMLPNGGVY